MSYFRKMTKIKKQGTEKYFTKNRNNQFMKSNAHNNQKIFYKVR